MTSPGRSSPTADEPVPDLAVDLEQAHRRVPELYRDISPAAPPVLGEEGGWACAPIAWRASENRDRSARARGGDRPTPGFDIIALEGTDVRCRVSASSGFYMRALAHDLGKRTRVRGLSGEPASRTKRGQFTLEHVCRPRGAGARPEPSPTGQWAHASYRWLTCCPSCPGSSRPRGASVRVAHGNVLMPDDFDAADAPLATTDDEPVSTSASRSTAPITVRSLAIAEQWPWSGFASPDRLGVRFEAGNRRREKELVGGGRRPGAHASLRVM